MRKSKIVIIGGGYAGVKMVEELSKYNDIDVILIDKSRFHYLQPQAHEFIAGNVKLNDIAIDLVAFCSSFKRVSFFE
ncbi:MAG: FAD-dependent oxidoreductase [Campylobacterales bacterium]|nr:FAD-dependent oxidoreductase [Campylobacterales bacterium]